MDALKTFLLSIWNFLLPILKVAWQIFRNWWWVLLLPYLYKKASWFWLFLRTEGWMAKNKSVLLEIKIPKETKKPVRAMEAVLAAMWQTVYLGEPNWHEKWWEGQDLYNIVLEIASINGEPHFFINIPAVVRDSIESAIFSQYPNAEISLADDYVKRVPQDIPNKDWDLFGADYKFFRSDAYPIRTYKFFETEHEVTEEQKIDPLAQLLEAMGKVKEGEQLWIQMRIKPVATKFLDSFLKESKELSDKLAKREKPEPGKSVPQELFDVFVKGEGEEPEKKKEAFPPEMRLTPGEKEDVTAVEAKRTKLCCDAFIRFIFLGKRDVFFKPNLRLPFGFFSSFSTVDLNALIPDGKTITKIKKNWYDWFFFIQPRLYLRKRKLFKAYKERRRYAYPRSSELKKDTFILNIEEIATLYHFPSQGSAPATFLRRIEAKKSGAPTTLPTG